MIDSTNFFPEMLAFIIPHVHVDTHILLVFGVEKVRKACVMKVFYLCLADMDSYKKVGISKS